MGPGLAIKSNQAAVNPQPINSNQLHLQSHRRLPVRLSRFAIRKLRRHPRLFRVPLSPINIAVVVLAYRGKMLTSRLEMVLCCLQMRLSCHVETSP